MPIDIKLSRKFDQFHVMEMGGTSLDFQTNRLGSWYLGPQFMYDDKQNRPITKGTYDFRVRQTQWLSHLGYFLGARGAPGLANIINNMSWLPDECTTTYSSQTRTLFGHTPSSHVIGIIPSFIDVHTASNFCNAVRVSFDIRAVDIMTRDNGTVNYRPKFSPGNVRATLTNSSETYSSPEGKDRIGQQTIAAYHRAVCISEGINNALRMFTKPVRHLDIAQEYHLMKIWYLLAVDMIGDMNSTDFWSGKQLDRWPLDLAIKEYFNGKNAIWNNHKAKAFYDLEKNVYCVTPEYITWVRQQLYGLIEWFPMYQRPPDNPENMIRDTKIMEQVIGYDPSQNQDEIDSYRLTTMVKIGDTREIRTFKMMTIEQFYRNTQKRKEVGGDLWDIRRFPRHVTSMFESVIDAFGNSQYNGMVALGTFSYRNNEHPVLYVPEPIYRYINYPTRSNRLSGEMIGQQIYDIGSTAEEQRLTKQQYHATIPNVITIHKSNVMEPFKVKQAYCFGMFEAESRTVSNLQYFIDAANRRQYYIMPYTMNALDAAMMSTIADTVKLNAKGIVKVWDHADSSRVSNTAMVLHEGRYLTL